MNRVLLIGCTGWGLLSLVGSTQAAPITFNTALPVAEGNFVLREQAVVMRSGSDPSGMGRDMAVDGVISVLGYGASEKLAVFGSLPYLVKDLDMHPDGNHVNRSNSGFGDLTLFGRQTLYQRDWPGQTLRVAGFAGLEAPTGEDDKHDAQGRLPPSLQLGSGSWDGFAGIVATWQTLDYQLDGQIAYRNNGAANGFEAGDEWRLDASLQYRLWPTELGAGVPTFLYGVLELNVLERERNRVSGVADSNSGGTTVFLTPGIQYVSKRWVWEAVLQTPVQQDLNGTALENDFILRAGFRHSF